ncbi:Metallo-dependent phosphatase-like protein [Crepidotus variabilis]|uniref:Metallo-dependent phosphatase-like protein n=1 Tax=Crepidotus variabilis TaxID=179855 RepID=A0A9P6ELD1_9AGAR|nr:Metallo-dependent phosphatase-like protein [Crepidotus variabilis]
MNNTQKPSKSFGDRLTEFFTNNHGKAASISSKSVAFETISPPKPELRRKAQLKYRSRVIRSSNAIAHLEYSPTSIPEKPLVEGEEWTRFVCISDTHTHEIEVPDGDVLLHSGDLTNLGTEKDFEKTMKWLCGLPHKVKIIIAGNHDLTLHTDWYEKHSPNFHLRAGKQDINKILPLLKGKGAQASNLVYLQDEVYRFKLKENGREWSVYGSPWSPEFCNWAFGYEPEDGKALVSKFPQTDILLTHGPPYALLDLTTTGELAGCKALRKRLASLKPRLHLFGHIHEAHGAYLHEWDKGATLPKVQNHEERGVEDSTSLEAELERLYVPQGLDEEQQNYTADNDDAELEEDFSSDDGLGNLDEEGNGKEKSQNAPSERPTLFVNAAAWPMGKLASRDGPKMNMFGGPGFQAVIVDLKD